MYYSECRSTKSHKIGHPFTLGKWEFSNLLKIAVIIAFIIAKSLQIIIKLQSLQSLLPTASAFNYVFKLGRAINFRVARWVKKHKFALRENQLPSLRTFEGLFWLTRALQVPSTTLPHVLPLEVQIQEHHQVVTHWARRSQDTVKNNL